MGKFNIKQAKEKPTSDIKTPFLRGKSSKQAKSNANNKKVYINFKSIYKDAMSNFQSHQKNW